MLNLAKPNISLMIEAQFIKSIFPADKEQRKLRRIKKGMVAEGGHAKGLPGRLK